MKDPNIMNVKEAAELLGVHKRTLLKLARARRVPAKKLGRQWRFHRLALDKWLGAPEQRLMPESSAESSN